MPAPKQTGEELVATILAAPYDPNYLSGWFVSFIGHVVDGRLQSPVKGEARRILVALADHETFLAEHPTARKTR